MLGQLCHKQSLVAGSETWEDWTSCLKRLCLTVTWSNHRRWASVHQVWRPRFKVPKKYFDFQLHLVLPSEHINNSSKHISWTWDDIFFWLTWIWGALLDALLCANECYPAWLYPWICLDIFSKPPAKKFPKDEGVLQAKFAIKKVLKELKIAPTVTPQTVNHFWPQIWFFHLSSLPLPIEIVKNRRKQIKTTWTHYFRGIQPIPRRQGPWDPDTDSKERLLAPGGSPVRAEQTHGLPPKKTVEQGWYQNMHSIQVRVYTVHMYHICGYLH